MNRLPNRHLLTNIVAALLIMNRAKVVIQNLLEVDINADILMLITKARVVKLQKDPEDDAKSFLSWVNNLL